MRVIKIVVATLAVSIYPASDASAGKDHGYEWINCTGGWMSYLYSWNYTGSDRRNYYWPKRSTNGGSSYQNLVTPYDEHDYNCLPVGVSFNYWFFTQACLNSNQTGSCNPTAVMVIPQQTCSGDPP
jgi:hypothetical protein